MTNKASFVAFKIFILILDDQVFAGNLAYTTTDEGLKTFFSAHASDMYVCHVAKLHSLVLFLTFEPLDSPLRSSSEGQGQLGMASWLSLPSKEQKRP